MSDTITYDIEELFNQIQEQQKIIKSLQEYKMMSECQIMQLKTELNILQQNDIVCDLNGHYRPVKDSIEQFKTVVNEHRHQHDDLKTTIVILIETLKTILETLPEQDRADSLIKIMNKGYCNVPSQNGNSPYINYTLSWNSMTKIMAYLLSQPESLIDTINSLSK